MRTEQLTFTGHGGMTLPATLWLPETAPQRVLQVTHGMTEHRGRYEALARLLTGHGMAVACFDLRGHGENPGSASVASFGPDGWEASLQDMRLFFELLQARLPGIPHDMLGFSLGSFLLREYLSRWKRGVSRAVIMGTGHQPGWLLGAMRAVVRGQIRKAGFDNTTALVRQLSFGVYNQRFRPNRTASDWLCADEAALDAYLADPLCRQDISAGLFLQLLEAMARTGKPQACAAWDPDMPVLLLSGREDAVGDAGRGVQALHRLLTRAGQRNVTMRLIPGARHMVLCEGQSGAGAIAGQTILDFLKDESKEQL